MELKPASAQPGEVRPAAFPSVQPLEPAFITITSQSRQQNMFLDGNLSTSLQRGGCLLSLPHYLRTFGGGEIGSCLYQPWGCEQQGLTLLSGAAKPTDDGLLRLTRWRENWPCACAQLVPSCAPEPRTLPPTAPEPLSGS